MSDRSTQNVTLPIEVKLDDNVETTIRTLLDLHLKGALSMDGLVLSLVATVQVACNATAYQVLREARA